MSYNKITGFYEGFIYIITNDINDKVYIGQTTRSVSGRWSQHKNHVKRKIFDSPLYSDMYKYGIDKFHIQTLRKYIKKNFDELKSTLNIREIYYISKYKSNNIIYGYNVAPGGNEISDKQKIKTYCFTSDGVFIQEFASRADAGNYIGVRGEDISGAILKNGLCRGYYFTSNPVFDYISPTHPMRENKVKAYNFNGILIKEYENCFDAANHNQYKAENIYNACLGIHTSAYGYIWRFLDDEFNTHRLPKKRTKYINQYSKDNQFIKTYKSIKEAANQLNIKSPNISAVLSPNCSFSKTAGGYKWYYANDLNQPDKTKIVI